MSGQILFRGFNIVNEGKTFYGDLLVCGERIERIDSDITPAAAAQVVEGNGRWLIPGAIDDQVHFREPGLTHKATIASESKAAVAGGITSFMEMPNTNPATTTQALLDWKFQQARQTAWANYSFYLGATPDNLTEIKSLNPQNICGVKIFMGSSTGNLLVDNPQILEHIFSESPTLIATHCEYEPSIQQSTKELKSRYPDAQAVIHPFVRSAEACFESSAYAVSLAKKHNTRLHILHISTEKELQLFDNKLDLKQKRITAEVCVHHLWFNSQDYERLGNLIKWNPAIKTNQDQTALWAGLLNNSLDIVATDHAPHTLAEKNKPYWDAPSGGPLVQHALAMMLSCAKQGKITVEKVIEKMCHAPAICFNVQERGFLREGYYADLVVINPNKPQIVTADSLLYACKWSPLLGETFPVSVEQTYINGACAWNNGKFITQNAQQLQFNS
ncbi:MAG: dihydroorotase [Bacteroidia bacterium]|nr:dihydroorotase [Bacteroidia bacterium]